MIKRYYSNELYHYGVPGMKWGHRKDPYSITTSNTHRVPRIAGTIGEYRTPKQPRNSISLRGKRSITFDRQRPRKSLKEKWNGLSDKQKTAIKIGAAAAATGLALYATYKISEKNADKLHTQFENSVAKGNDFFRRFIITNGAENSAYSYKSGTVQLSESKENPYYERGAKSRDLLRKNIYNRLTGKYDEDIATSLVRKASFTKDSDPENRYARSTKFDDRMDNFSNEDYVYRRKQKRNKQK